MLTIDEFCMRVLDGIGIDYSPPIDTSADLYAELGVDSLQSFQLIVLVEALAGCDSPPVELPHILTLSDAFVYFISLCNSAEVS
jgi:acyl carrier protein